MAYSDVEVDSTAKDETAESASKDVTQALARFALAVEAEKKQRDRELEDLRFVDDPDGQWPEAIRRQRKGGTEAGIVIPERPCLTVDKVSPAIDQIVNQAKNSRLAVKVKPKGSKASQKVAERIQGLYRNIEVESRAHVARIWALERASKSGRGYYRILTDYANDGDDDLDIIIDRILNQHSVYLDPFHQKPDGRDAEWAFIVEDMPVSRYKREHPRSKLAAALDDKLQGIGDVPAGWMNGEGEAATVRVAEYFCVKHGDSEKKTAKGREVRSRKVMWQKINCCEVLDEQELDGRYIPIVQVIGKEHNVNGERSYTGIVAKSKDAQRVYNVMLSREMETIGLASNAPWLIMEGLIEGYEKVWEAANTRNFPYLPFRAKNINGNFAPPPQRNIAEPPIMAISQAIAQASDDIKSTTKTFDPSLGNLSRGERSGKAIQALQQQSEHGNSNYLEDLAQISMAHEARIVLDLIPKVYDRPGRVAQILGVDDEPEAVMLNAPFVKGPDGQPQAIQQQPGQPLPPEAEVIDLRDGEYSVQVSVGKSFTTQREEASAMVGEMMSAGGPQMAPALAPIFFKYSDWPGAQEAYEVTKKLFWPPELQQDGQGQPAGDPQAQAQIQALTQQLQAMQQALQEAQSGIAQAQIKAESAEKIKGAELEVKAYIEEQKAELAKLKLAVETGIKQQQMQLDAAKTAVQMEQAERQAARQDVTHAVDLNHDREMAETSHIHEVERAAAEPREPRA